MGARGGGAGQAAEGEQVPGGASGRQVGDLVGGGASSRGSKWGGEAIGRG